MPRATLRAAVDHAEQRPDGHLLAGMQPRLELFEAPVVHADLAAPAALTASDEDRPAPAVEIEFGEIERFLDAQAGTPEHGDQPPRAVAVQPVAAAAHDRDDLRGARRAAGEIARHGGRRAAATERIQRR